jgi:hypothetical protein
VTADEQRRDEPLDARLRRETPDVGADDSTGGDQSDDEP